MGIGGKVTPMYGLGSIAKIEKLDETTIIGRILEHFSFIDSTAVAVIPFTGRKKIWQAGHDGIVCLPSKMSRRRLDIFH